MNNQDSLFLWKAKLLEKIYRFAVIFGFITLIVSGTITYINGYYLQTILYTTVYLIALFSAFKSGLTYNFKVYSLITMTFILAIVILLLEGDLTIGFVWLIYSIFFAVTFLEKRQFLIVILISALLVAFWYVNYINQWFIPVRKLTGLYFYIKFTNSTIFLIGGILYVNDQLIRNIANSLENERTARKELRNEKVVIEETNKFLKIKLNEIDALKNQLEQANSMLSVRVEEQEVGIKETMTNLKMEILNHKSTEKELIKTKEELILSLDKEKALNEMKSKFISMISHEYRTPLTVLMNSTYLLDKYFETNDKEKFDDSLNKINYSVESMTDLLEEVIRFGHSDLDERDNELAEIDIIHQISTVIKNFEHQDNVKYNIKIDATEDPFIINTDGRKIRLILNNIIKNAIIYSKDKPEISIIIERVSNAIHINVKDKGIGITSNDYNNIFEPFYRGENTIGKSGMGLGLAIAKRYTESLNGNLLFDSQTGKGSNFTLILPI